MRTGAKSGGARKVGRGMESGKRYRMAKRRERSHIRRIKRHQEVYKDTSPMVLAALKKYTQLLKRGDNA